MKVINGIKQTFLAGCISVACIAPVFADDSVGPDFSSLTSSVNFSSVIIAVLSIAAGIMGLTMAVVGARKLIGFFRGS